ncbi:hypothetical protein Misp06_02752 [Microbulbifer sp. NBRC 101763]
MKTQARNLARIVGVLVILTSIVHWKSFFISISMFGTSPGVASLGLLLLALAIFSAVGLLAYKGWGFLVFYCFALLATIGFSIPLIPFVASWFPLAVRPWVMIAINIFILIAILAAHSEWRKSRAAGEGDS